MSHLREGFRDFSSSAVFATIVLMRMKIVTVSRKGQITIPQALRERMGLQPGDTVEVWVDKGSIAVQSVKPRAQQSRTA